MDPGISGSPARTIGVLRLLLGAAVLVPALLAGVAAWQSRGVLVEEAEQRAVKTATILEQHVASTFEIYRLVFSRVEDFLRSRPDARDPVILQPFLKRLAEDVGRINDVYVVDATGRMISHHRVPPQTKLAIDVSDRDYFIALKDGSKRIAIGAPVTGRLSGDRRINVSYRLTTDSGGFAGIVVVSIAEDYFTSIYGALREEPGDILNVVRDDGLLLVRSPPAPAGQIRDAPGQFRPLDLSADRGLYHKRSSLDGTERIYAFRRVPDLPLIVAFGVDQRGVMAEWTNVVLTYAGIAVPAALLLLFATLIALQRARREAAAYEELRRESGQRAAAEAQREEAEAALRQAQKMEALGQLTGGIAHDFNNLLTVISGNIDLAIKKLAGGGAGRHLEASLKATERGQRLTQQLLAFARRRPLRSAAVSLPDRLQETVAFVGQTMGPGITITVELPPDLGAVEVDDEQLQVALLNLIVNARDAMPDGGEIRLSARNLHLSGTEPDRDGLAGAYVALSVSDTGKGIAAEVLLRVFEPFFTTKAVGRGSGLGLAQVYSFAKQSNGLATIESAVGRGTTVTLYLPRATGPVHRREPAATPSEPIGSARRILIVEDDREVAEVARGYLEAFGWETVIVDRAAKALAWLARDTAFDLVLSDIIMPDGMSGIELSRQLARSYPLLPVLLTTGYAGPQPDTDALSVEVLRKPYNARTLREAIERTLGIHARQRPPIGVP